MEYNFTAENFEQEVLKSQIPVLVDFYADWCAPCMMMAPIIERLAKEYEGRIKIGKVNVDDEMALAQQYRVSSIPNLKIFQGGVLQSQMVGAQSESELKKVLDGLL